MGGWARSASADPVSGSRRATYATFVNPNARCPECRAQVFFYQSENGGRVFFDELGPPWPKHECTSRVFPRAVDLGDAVELKLYAWQNAGWSPLLSSSLASITPTLMRLSGYIADEYETFYVPKAALPRGFDQRKSSRSLCHVRKILEGVFEVAWLTADAASLAATAYGSDIEAEPHAKRLSEMKRLEGPHGVVRRSKT